MLPCRSEGIIERCFIAAQELPITKHLDLALCFATLILACSLHDAAALTHPAALATIQRLLHVRLSPLQECRMWNTMFPAPGNMLEGCTKHKS